MSDNSPAGSAVEAHREYQKVIPGHGGSKDEKDDVVVSWTVFCLLISAYYIVGKKINK